MRKLPLFSAVLSLFLLVPASITRAQVTKTLNGTVRYESGMSETKFSTPNGDVRVNLPQSMSGATITGTVSTEPAGKTEKEKKRNLDELLKYVVNLNGTKIPLSVKPANFEWTTIMDKPLRNPLELLNASGVKVAEVSLPPVLSLPAPMAVSNNGPVLSTPSNILVKGDVLNVYTNQQFSPGEKFVLTDSKGQQFTLTPICLSAEQAVMNVPEGVVPGNCTIREEVSNQAVSVNNGGVAGFAFIDINLSSPNTNLRNGQTSSVTLTIDTRDPAEIDSNEFLVFRVDMKNLTPGVVDMAGGNNQTISFPINGDHKSSSAWQLTRTITGIKPGNFSVSATLHEDYTSSNDPFRPEINVLKTPEDFNAWANALKKDLKALVTMRLDDEAAVPLTSFSIQRAIDNMPVCTDPEQLDESKAVAYSLIRPLNIPKGVTNFWPSGLEAYKAAIKTIPSVLSVNPNLIDYEVIKKGLAYADKMGKVLGYDLRNSSADAGKIITQIQTEGETKENLKRLEVALSVVNTSVNQAINEMPVAMKLLLPGGMLFSTKFTPPGMTNFSAEVTEISWDNSVGSEVKDRIQTKIHFTDEVTVQKFAIRVKWVSKDGKKEGAADCIRKPTDLYYAQTDKFFNCDTIPISLRWPESFKSSGIIEPLSKNEIDLDKLKVIVFVNGNKVGEGKPEGD